MDGWRSNQMYSPPKLYTGTTSPMQRYAATSLSDTTPSTQPVSGFTAISLLIPGIANCSTTVLRVSKRLHVSTLRPRNAGRIRGDPLGSTMVGADDVTIAVAKVPKGDSYRCLSIAAAGCCEYKAVIAAAKPEEDGVMPMLPDEAG